MEVSKEELATTQATETLKRSDKLIHRLAIVIALIITITCIGVLVLAFQTAELLKEDAEEDARIASDTKKIAENNQMLLEQSQPCLPSDPPESPACQEAKRVAALVDDIIQRIATEQANRLTIHDENVRRDHEALHRMHRTRRATRLPQNTPIPKFTTTTKPTTTTTTAPASTTTAVTLPQARTIPTAPISCDKDKKTGECKKTDKSKEK